MINRKLPTRFYSKKQETNVAKKLNMKVQPNSGATPFKKGDIADENLVIECKTIIKPQTTRTIHKIWFDTIMKERYAMGKQLSAVAFDFGDGENYVALTEDDFKDLYECWKQVNNY